MIRYFLLVMVVFLGACNPFADFKLDSQKIQSRVWAPPSKEVPKKDIFCYKTLGECVCYNTPQPHLENRLINPLSNLDCDQP
jgi:hypothetical protein